MTQERLRSPTIVSLETYANHIQEHWMQKWQDLNFTKSFPKLVANVISPEAKSIFTDNELETMTKHAIESFMGLSWKSGKHEYVAGFSQRVNENLEVSPSNPGPNIEILGRCIIGSLALLDKSIVKNFLSESYQKQLRPEKRYLFRQHVSRLLRRDSFFSNFVKNNSLDSKNDFEWYRQSARLFLWDLKPGHGKLPTEFFADLAIYPLEVIDEFLNYAIEYIHTPYNSANREGRKKKETTDFLVQLQKLSEIGYFDDSLLSVGVQEKIEEVKNSR